MRHVRPDLLTDGTDVAQARTRGETVIQQPAVAPASARAARDRLPAGDPLRRIIEDALALLERDHRARRR